MGKITLVFGTTNSQPVGTDPSYLEEIYQRSYKPFVRNLYNAPNIRATLHFSGALLQWLEENHSEFTDVLSELSGRRQVELLGGGFYDPVLPLIPRADRLGQIERMTTYLRKRVGRRPRGAWVTEHVWEPSLPSLLKTSGMEYTFLDDYHFLTAGFSGEDLIRPCITEDEGKTLIVFPVCRELIQDMDRLDPEAFIQRIYEAVGDTKEAVISLFPKGEELGKSDAAYNHFFENGWFREFFRLLEEHQERIRLTHPWRYLRGYVPRRRGYFPSTSYEDMMCWTLPAEEQARFEGLRKQMSAGAGRNGYIFGGFFRQFLTRYPESNLMYAKMQYTHILVNQLRGDKARKQLAREELWKGQCHHAYWHGRAGGIYINRLRKTVYGSLIEAEKVTREKGIFIPSIMHLDFDMDGMWEYLYQGHDVNAYIHKSGGHLFELDYLPVSWNYLDTLARHKEAYHSSTDAENGYDAYPRKAFVDHFLHPQETLSAFARGQHAELGSFVDAVFETEEYAREEHELALSATGYVVRQDDLQAVHLRKRFRFYSSALIVEVRIRNDSNPMLECDFASEINLSMLDGSADSQSVQLNGDDQAGELQPFDTGQHGEVREILAQDEVNRVRIRLDFDQPCQLWTVPVLTHAYSEDGPAQYYQSSCFLPRWHLQLPAGQEWHLTARLNFEQHHSENSGQQRESAGERSGD